MSQQIVRQSDGLYVVFDSGTGTLAVVDATPAELADYFAEQASERARIAAQLSVAQADDVAAGRLARRPFLLDYAKAYALDRGSAAGGNPSALDLR